MLLKPGGERDARLLFNRSLALHRTSKHAAAAEDAQRACELEPRWSKAWYRLGTAQSSLGKPNDALAAFAMALQLEPFSGEIRAAVRTAVRRMTREELAIALLAGLEDSANTGLVCRAEREDVSRQEKEEAMFRHIMLWQLDKPSPGDYYDYVALWSEHPWSAGVFQVP
jgi:tetratricopeptide (TPR) repeat protein